ncbi:MAG: HAD family phosphatase [Clostridia bacterium]|nr:HAD family phosphatase [Clostridia bacterium]
METNIKKKIECVIFDFGGVISFPQQKQNVDNMIKLTKMSEEDFLKAYFSNRLDYDRGIIGKKEYWQMVTNNSTELRDELLSKLAWEDCRSWTNINEQVIDFINALKNKVKKVALLSNINFEVKDYVKDELGLFKYFDETICSCDLQLLKPELGIYQYAANKVGIEPEKCLFIDDMEANVIGAREAGLNSMVFQGYGHLVDEIDKLYELNL